MGLIDEARGYVQKAGNKAWFHRADQSLLDEIIDAMEAVDDGRLTLTSVVAAVNARGVEMPRSGMDSLRKAISNGTIRRSQSSDKGTSSRKAKETGKR
jgi:hypothetical protein